MFNAIDNKDALSLINDEYFIIVSSNKEAYYKKKFINNNYKIFNINNFIIKFYNGNLKLAKKEEKFLLMHKAYNDKKNSLIKYNNVNNLSFINDLLSTYKEYKPFKLEDNDKIRDLKIIYDYYEELLYKYELINEELMFSHVIKTNIFDKKYIFLELDDINDNIYKLMGKMNENGKCFLSINENNTYLKELIGDKSIASSSFDNHSFYALNDIEEELSFILNDITKKVYDGAKYKDFVIVSPSLDTYIPYFKLVFDFPYSSVKEVGLLTYRFIKLIINILEGDFSSSSFINLLKLELFKIDLRVINKLDNYVYEYNLEKENINEVLKDNLSDGLIEEFNCLKEKVINPLRLFLENIKDENESKNVLKKFWLYLEENSLDEELFSKDPDGYGLLVNALEYLNDYADDSMDTFTLLDILEYLVKSKNVKTSYVDEVTISNLEDANFYDKKYIYLIGASSDKMPKTFSLSPLLSFSDVNKDFLIKRIKQFSNYEKALFLNIIKNENVIITMHKLAPDLSLKTPSIYIPYKPVDIKNKLYNKKLIINNYSKNLSLNKVNKLVSDNKLINLINLSYDHNLDFKINEESTRNLYSNVLSCSPSSIETYSKCNFYHFCQYGLRLKIKEKRTFDNREVGSLMHYILEKILKYDFNVISLSNIEDKVTYYAFKYLEENNRKLDNTTRYVVNKIAQNTFMVIKNIIEEQSVSKFKPRFMEFRVSDGSIIKPVIINLDKGVLKLSGVVDRIDVCESDDKYLYRVVDYKTGGKKLRLDDCLDGLNLQMLLYLLAIKESNNVTNKKMVASAVLYYPLTIKEKKESRSFSKEEKDLSIKQRLLMDGIINYDEDVLEALGGDDLGLYIDAISRGKLKDEKIFGIDDLNLLFDNIKNTIKKIGDDILNGKIAAYPVKGRTDACEFCKFSSICSFDKETSKTRRLKNYKNREVLKMLGGDNDA